MTDYKNIKCNMDCGLCNKKGLPSVTKGSVACEKRRGTYETKEELEKQKQSFFYRLTHRDIIGFRNIFNKW